MTHFLTSQYWIARNAITFVLNAMGDPQKVSVSISSGAVVMAYMPGVEGLGYDNSHSYRRWRIRGYASVLKEAVVTHEVSGEPVDTTYPATGEKYVYILIPRNTQTVGEEAVIGFAPCEIDYLGYDANGVLIGNSNYFYLYTRGIISASVEEGPRSWSHPIETGTLATDEAYDAGGPNPWYEWNSVTGTVRFLKQIFMDARSWFENLRASAISFVGDGTGTGVNDKGTVNCVANFSAMSDNRTEAIVTPKYLLDREAQIEQKYLRKDQADSTPYKLTAADLEALNKIKAKLAEIEESMTVGKLNDLSKGTLKNPNFQDDFLNGTSWGIFPSGRMQLNTLEVRTSLKVLELIFNRLTATESDYVFTEAGTIEEILSHEGDQYVLQIEKRHDTDFHAFRCGDILRGVYNDLANLGGGQFFTSWMRVTAIDTSVDAETNVRNNTITVVIYPGMSGDDPVVPGGVNYPPQKLMVLQRWGNVVEPTAESHASLDYASFIVDNGDGTYRNTRQACWYLSSIEKRIAMLDGVDAPILRESNYTAFFGLPYNLSTFKGHTMNPTQPYLYVRGAFLQDIHYIDYQGNIIRQERNRGVWTQEEATNDPYVKNDSTFDTCYYNNRKWQVVVSQARALPPSADNADWLMLYEGMTPQYRIIPSVLNVLRNPDGTTSLVNNLITCDVVVDEGGDEPRFAPESEVEVYIGVNGDTPTHVSPYRQHTIAATDHSIEFYLWNKMSEFGEESELGDAIFAYLTGMVSVPIYERGSNGDTPTIDPTTGNWIINGVVTEHSSHGDDGHSPYVGDDGYWYEWDAVNGQYHKTAYYAEGNQVLAQYSEDCIDWYDVYFSGALWMRTKKTGDANWGDPFRCVGEKGEGGNYVNSEFAISSHLTLPLDDVSSNQWQDAPPATTSAKPYLWMRQMLREWDTNTNAYVNGWDSFKFTRVTGEKGDSGVGISTLTEEYAVSDSANTQPSSEDWTTLANAQGQWDAEMPYLWNRETVTYTRDKSADVKVHIVAVWSEDGRSLTNIENWYKTSANSSETAGGTAQGWQKDTPNGLPFDDTHPYLWNYEKLLFSDGTSQNTTPAIKSIFSRGARGVTLRGPSIWEPGKVYQGGNPGDDYQDIVICEEYPEEMFLCKFTHTSGDGTGGSINNYPPDHFKNSGWDRNDPWTESEIRNFTATRVLFAQRGSIQNVNIGDATIINATIKGTLSEEMLDTQEELDNATRALCPDLKDLTPEHDPEELLQIDEYQRTFQALDVTRGSIMIPVPPYVVGEEYETLLRRNKIIFLPRYISTELTVDYSGIGEDLHKFTIPGYTQSGTHLTISVASPPIGFSLWSVMTDSGLQDLFTNNRSELLGLYNMGVLICADPLMMSDRSRSLYGGYYYGSNMIHGRFAFNGGSSRFIFVMPGQTLHLISAIEEYNGDTCLTWYVQNASDFEPLTCKVTAPNPAATGTYNFWGHSNNPDPTNGGASPENWQDLIVGSHKMNPYVLDPNDPLTSANYALPLLGIGRGGTSPMPSWGWYMPQNS